MEWNNIHFATILMIIYKVKNKDFYVPEKPIHRFLQIITLLTIFKMIHIIHLIIFRFGELSCIFKTVENDECVHFFN